MRHFDLDDRQIGFPVAADDLGRIADRGRFAHQADSNAVGFVHHVEVGDDVAAGADDDAGAERLRPHIVTSRRAAVIPLRSLAEEAGKPVLHAIAPTLATRTLATRTLATRTLATRTLAWNAHAAMRILNGRFGVDIDHGGLNVLGHAGKLVIVQPRRRHTQAGRVAAVDIGCAGRIGEHGANHQHQRNRDGSDENSSKKLLLAAQPRGLGLIVRRCAGTLQRFHVSSGQIFYHPILTFSGKRGARRPGQDFPTGVGLLDAWAADSYAERHAFGNIEIREIAYWESNAQRGTPPGPMQFAISSNRSSVRAVRDGPPGSGPERRRAR